MVFTILLLSDGELILNRIKVEVGDGCLTSYI